MANKNFNPITKNLAARLKTAGISSVICTAARAYAQYEFSVVDIKRSLHIVAVDLERPEIASEDVIKAIINHILNQYAK